MMDALVTLSADNCHTSPPILTIISFRRLGLLLLEFEKKAILVKLRRKERKEIWICEPRINEEAAVSLEILN